MIVKQGPENVPARFAQFLAGAGQERPDGGAIALVPQNLGGTQAGLRFGMMESPDQLLWVTARGGSG